MSTKTYRIIMTTLSVIGLVAMIVAMASINQDRNRMESESDAEMHQVTLIPTESQQGLSDSLGKIRDFELTNQSGQTTTRNDLDGKIWVADFIFTSCEGICPTMTKNLATVQKAFSDSKDVHFISITVDPETDTPEVLTAFSEEFNVNPEQWDFLTGPKDYIKELSYQGFMLGSGPEMTDHSPKFILIDRDGDIRGLYDGTELPDVERLKVDIQTLLNETI